MNRRNSVLALMAFGASVWSFAGRAQPAAKPFRIGWLSPATSTSGAMELQTLLKSLRDLGYVEGKSLLIETRWANGEPGALPSLARSLVEIKVDVICPAGTPAALAAQQATATIPIVFSAAAFPDETGLVASYARPGANITGTAFVGPEYAKRLELLRELSPRLTRVALLYNDANPASLRALKEVRGGAEKLRITIEPHSISQKRDVESALAAIARNLPGGLMTTADRFVISFKKEIVDFAAKHRLLALYPSREFVEAGGLIFYGSSVTDMMQLTATYIHRILHGAKPADLPVGQPTKFDMEINLRTAKALGLQFPQTVLLRADKLIE